MPRLIVRAVGPSATIQDGGRFGYLRFGVTPSGPMDWIAFETANRALGNAPDATAIEIGPGGITLDVDAPVPLAFAGGGFEWTRGGMDLAPDARIMLKPGEMLRARAVGWGRFAYCAVPGGIDVPEVMGSRATHTRAGLGGLDGRMLSGGDTLTVLGDPRAVDDALIDAPWLRKNEEPFRVILGPQDDYFTDDAISVLQSSHYKLTVTSDRMAYKFEGPTLAHKGDFNIVSDGIALGAIQVAGDGQPMVLMADRQPTGGYTKIAHVCRADIGRLAQLRPGDMCRFTVLDSSTALAALTELKDQIATTAEHMEPMRRPPTAASLMQFNLVGGVSDGSE